VSVKLDDTIYLHCGTASASTGAATDADSTPTCTVEEDGVALGYAPTVTNVATGLYRITIACTIANGFEAGKRYSAYVVATVGGITGRDSIAEFSVATNDIDSVIAAMWAKVIEGTVTAEEALKTIFDAAAADTTGFPSSPIIKSLDGSKNRISATLDANSNRTVTARDLT
jgi:hypothetical protein